MELIRKLTESFQKSGHKKRGRNLLANLPDYQAGSIEMSLRILPDTFKINDNNEANVFKNN